MPGALEFRSMNNTGAAVRAECGDPIVAHFVPRWPCNPYHAELAKHLVDWGVRVDEADSLKTIFAQSRASGSFPDIIHLHAIPRFTPSPVQAARCFGFWSRVFSLRQRGVKLVWTIHNSSHHEAVLPLVDLKLSRILYRWANAVIAHSPAARRIIEQQWNVDRSDHVFIIPHGNYIASYPNVISQQAAREKLRVPLDKIVFLFLGLIRPYKGLPRLIEAFKRLSHPDTHLFVVGAPLSKELSLAVERQAEGRSNIEFRPGFVPNDQLQDYLNASDVAVFPYTHALSSGALILAMSFRRACIAPRLGALEDTLDEQGGFPYEPDAPDGLFQALAAATRDRARLKAMGEHNRRRAEEWDWTSIARMTAQVYRQCLARSR